ncbi:MAG TPA: S8 family serine peptidase [Solirubrobacteraceae bacterium]|nr:S8 family serine peptidase [Solirubrobacteraceae bacterium]
MVAGEDERGREVRARLLKRPAAEALRHITLALALALLPVALPEQPTGRLLVSLRAPARGQAHAAAVQALLARSGTRLDGPSVPAIGMLTVRPPASVSLRAELHWLRARPGVRAVSVERSFSARAVPDDPALATPESAPGTPPGTPIEWWAARENFPQAWAITKGDGARVAVIDSGVDVSHPELAGKIAHLADFDDVAADGSAIVDKSGHGTHVAGLACAAGGNAIGLVGAGYDCKLLVEKSDLTEASVIESIVDAADHGAQAINMSFGTSGSIPAPAALRDAVAYAYRRNVVMVAAAADTPVQEQGDPANVLQPRGSAPDIIKGLGLTVTSASFSAERSPFAGYGSEISLAAYGSFDDGHGAGGPPGIFSTFPAATSTIELGLPGPPCTSCRTTLASDRRYAYLEGSSMAAPQVAATAALIRQLNPGLSAAQIIELLKLTAQRAAGSGWNRGLGWGILDAGAAVSAARGMRSTSVVSARRSAHAKRRSRATHRVRRKSAHRHRKPLSSRKRA